MMHGREQVASSVGRLLWDYGETVPFLRGGHLVRPFLTAVLSLMQGAWAWIQKKITTPLRR